MRFRIIFTGIANLLALVSMVFPYRVESWIDNRFSITPTGSFPTSEEVIVYHSGVDLVVPPLILVLFITALFLIYLSNSKGARTIAFVLSIIRRFNCFIFNVII